ncbi:MAG: CAP domain-containing protein [Anaerolineaceae bacterium]|nr:CAP domain-containing protein [Anaerolineaceae bacterium]
MPAAHPPENRLHLRTLPAPQVYSATFTPIPVNEKFQINSEKATALSKIENEENTLLNLINQERQLYGLQPLQFNFLLDQAAYLHSFDMAMQNFVDHQGFDGSYVHVRVTRQGYEYAALGETICANATAEECFQLWKSNPDYSQVLLYEGFQDIGIGIVEHAESEHKIYYTAVFATPR